MTYPTPCHRMSRARSRWIRFLTRHDGFRFIPTGHHAIRVYEPLTEPTSSLMQGTEAWDAV